MRQEVQRSKVQAQLSLHYQTDITYESRMIARVRVAVKRALCVHCGESYMPRFLGDQVCQGCR